MTVAEEVHFLFPEGKWALDRVKDEPQHVFFKQFGEAMPDEDWNDPGTKQGIYMIGPNAEYLEGGGAISGSPQKVRRRLEKALERWKKLSKQKRYANRKVPHVNSLMPPKFEDKDLVLRVHLRDLPRGKGDDSGRRVTKADRRNRMWMAFTEWAWNENWIAFDDSKAFVTKSSRPRPVDAAIVMRLCRDVLVDNVRGQTPRWKKESVKEAELSMRRLNTKNGRWTIQYVGHARMEAGEQRYSPQLYGQAVWNSKRRRFESLELLAIGMRAGAGVFNQRKRDLGPAPMGIALGLHVAEQ